MSIIVLILNCIIVALAANLPLVFSTPFFLLAIIYSVLVFWMFVAVNVKPGKYKVKIHRLRVLEGGSDLLIIFAASSLFTIGCYIYTAFLRLPSASFLITYAIVAILVEAVVFWNGMIRVYLTSVQLGIRWRVLGAVFGMAPIINLIFLAIIISVTKEEARVEAEKKALNDRRKHKQVCKTRYPLLLVHGVFFRDNKLLNYWGKIPNELSINGAAVFYANQQSALSVKDSAAEIVKRIEEICAETGAEKVNIIAHSKGGLDSRYAITYLGADKRVASLTTVNTPHRGCIFADRLYDTLPASTREKIAAVYNTALKKLGDKSPDFLAAVCGLKSSVCVGFDEETKDVPAVLYQSVGSFSKGARGGRFPLNLSYPLVKHFDGENDGLVAVSSMSHGAFTLVSAAGKRGVTHADMIDLNRENFKGFDVREFYVGLVNGLKEKGL